MRSILVAQNKILYFNFFLPQTNFIICYSSVRRMEIVTANLNYKRLDIFHRTEKNKDFVWLDGMVKWNELSSII